MRIPEGPQIVLFAGTAPGGAYGAGDHSMPHAEFENAMLSRFDCNADRFHY